MMTRSKNFCFGEALPETIFHAIDGLLSAGEMRRVEN
jgi:hypothetical protein